MFEITVNKPTVIKKRLLQSTDLPADEKKTMLPGQYLNTEILEEAPGNHWKILIDNTIWYVYQPHWTAENLGKILDLPTLQKVYTYTDTKILQSNLPHLNSALKYYKINLTTTRLAYFLAQIGHESGGMRYNLELASGIAYENRRDLGNVFPGDGPRYKGRGFIQLTGRHNYRNAGKALGIDLENNPELARDVRYQSAIACWFWNSRNLNLWSDKENFEKVTRLINGGLNGYQDRLKYLERANAALKK
jgi:putative chitinase